MAEQSHHDEVNQSMSTDALSSVDASASVLTVSAARAAGEKPTTNSHHSEIGRSDADDDTTSDAKHSDQDTSQALPGHVNTNPAESQSAASQVDIPSTRDQDAAYDDEAARSFKGDGSVGSDTDTSKNDPTATALKENDGREGGSRFTLKKSTSFKPVSVTKNFLAKAGSVSTPIKPSSGGDNSPATPGGSPAPSNLPTPRPRLVAKSVSGQRGILPKTTSSTASDGKINGPDPNQVWNKNRVQTPQAVPKQLTDEELRQQYGIQLASRPLEDGDSNQAKWADIDDEDDWAPETIEWNDGTKVNLAEQAAAASESAKTETDSKKVELKPSTMQSLESPSKATSIGPNATVLKLGSASQHRSSNSFSKQAPEKPSLVSKPASSVPVKSPWAPLPVIEKVSPLQITPQPQAGQSRFGQKDPHGFDAMPSASSAHAKEIEADDFSRFTRDASNGVPRELYIPQSGKYEPVRDSRRQSVRTDGSFRQPSVLQRTPFNDREADAHPGPSAAFQTNRSQQDSGPWSRRRASSGVSGESGKFGARFTAGRNYDGARAGDGSLRRDSAFDQSGHRDTSPAHSYGRSMTSISPTVSQPPDGPLSANAMNGQVVVAAMPPDAQANMSNEDPVALQRRLMREKREAAIKRRKEEEEREEAARRERIRIKMEELGMSTEDKSKKKTSQSEEHEQGQEASSRPPSKDTNTAQVTSPPKPPVPGPSGEPQQYGLMKVHAPQPSTNIASTASAATSGRPFDSTNIPRDAMQSANLKTSPQLANGEVVRGTAANASKSRSDPLTTDSGTGSQSWTQMQTQPQLPGANLAGWSASSMGGTAASNGNLWGPPSNQRALGNGDFQARGILKPSQPSYPVSNASTTPQPIGTPRQHASRNVGGANHLDPHTLSLIDDLQPIPHLTSPEPGLHRNNEVRADNHVIPRTTQEHSSLLNHVSGESGVPNMDSQHTGLAAWSTFSTSNGRHEVEQAARERAAHLNDPAAGMPRSQDQLPVLKETWKQVSRGAEAGQRRVVSSTHVTNNYASGIVPQPTAEFQHRTTGAVGGPHTRSRFQAIFEHQQKGTPTPSVSLPQPPSPSIPPPESTEHPAYVGEKDRPLVNLPPAVEKPIVKLPPSKDYSKEAHVPPPAPPQEQSWSGVVKQTPATQSWQDRINGLWATKSIPSPPVQTASKPRFDIHHPDTALAISLPPKHSELDLDVHLKAVEGEEALFEEEREFGSIPTVKIAALAENHPAWTPAPRPDWRDRRFRPLRDQEISSVVLFDDALQGQTSILVTVLLTGMKTPINKPLSREPLQGPRKTNRQPLRRHPFRPGKGRDVSHGSAPGSTTGDNTSAKDGAANAVPKSVPSRGFKNQRSFRGNRSVSATATTTR